MLHVYPIGDLIEHDFSTDCKCGVVFEWDSGEAVCIHRAYDGRDMLEQAAQIMENS